MIVLATLGCNQQQGHVAEIAVPRQVSTHVSLSSLASAGDRARYAGGVCVGCQGPAEAGASPRRLCPICGLRSRDGCTVQGATVKNTVLITPLFFGVAHLHHLYDEVTVQQVPFALAVQQVLRTPVELPSLLSYELVLF